MNYIDEEENKILLDALPQISPFLFIDKILNKSVDTFTTSSDLYPLKKYFNKIGCISSQYPMSLLIEHAAQTMFLHGYYLGKEKRYWNYDYTPSGVLVGLENICYYDEDISYSDRLITTTCLIKNKKQIIYLNVTTKSKQKGTIIFEGIIKGMYLNKTQSIGHKQPIKIVNKKNSNCLKFYEKKNHLNIFSSTYWFLTGHFPELPSIPGCLLLDGYIQSCGETFSTIKIKKIKFKRLATPDNTYLYRTKEVNRGEKFFEILNATDNSICVEGILGTLIKQKYHAPQN